MKAVEENLLKFLKNSDQFVIPIYQRTYSWTERECRQLWKDIMRVGSDEAITTHFIGSVVYIIDGLYQSSSQSSLLVIDGQQRLTSMSLLLEALARRVGEDEPLKGFSAKKIRNYYLLNQDEEGEDRFKMLLTQTDKASLLSLVQQHPQPQEQSLRIVENFEFFEKQIQSLGDDLEVLCQGLAKLVIVDISLSREQDNPQLIFESMNSTGKELSQADLIRNFILMGLEPKLQTDLYEVYWRPMEIGFGQEAYGAHFDSFMRHFLTYKTGTIPNVNAVYEAFKAYSHTPAVLESGVQSIVADLHEFAGYYCRMALGKEPDKKLSEAFHDLRELKIDVAYPLLLELYHDYATDILPLEDFTTAVRMVEAYVFRRTVCAIPTNSLNKTFATFGKDLKKDRYLESIQAAFLLLPSYRRFPTCEEFRREIKVRDLYNFRSKSYWLRRMENFNRKERVVVNDYTIEHILPQNQDVPQHWRDELGPDWQRIHETWLHTLGNLTLTGYNSEYSDHKFSTKQTMEGGFKVSPIKLNDGLGDLPSWNENSIKDRAEKLSKKALDVWSAPVLDADVLDAYRPAPKEGAQYSIDDHPHIAKNAGMRDLFNRFGKEVLALDPCVNEEFLKLYVAYKAETNFVDVVPQKSRLRLALNMKFHEINDPRGLCKDVANLGRWGNGDVEVSLESIEELPYVVGLVRQALEKQLGNGGV